MRRVPKILTSFFVLVVCALAVTASRAQDGNTYPLSFEEASRLALSNNFEIQLLRYDASIARTGEGTAESIYDTIFEADIRYQDDQRKRTTTILGTKVVNNDYNFGFLKKLPTGTTVELDVLNNRESTNSAFATSSLTHESSVGVTIQQALGRNFFGVQDRGSVKLTIFDIENTEWVSLDGIESDLANVQRAYWDLVLARDILAVEKDMLKQARKLYELNAEKIEDGLIEAPELLASEANLSQRRNDVLLAQNDADTKENILKLLLNITDENIRLSPTDSLSAGAVALDEARSMKRAVESRKDYKSKKKIVEARKLNLELKKKSLWPEINLSASLQRNGLGAHFDNSLGEVVEEDNPNFVAQLTVTFPLENTEARSALKKARLQDARALLNLKYVERRIATEIINQVRTCRVLGDAARNQNAIADIQSKKLAAEEKRFRYGRSDTDTVIRFQEDVLIARRRAAEAGNRYKKALVELKRREGRLLEKYIADLDFFETAGAVSGEEGAGL